MKTAQEILLKHTGMKGTHHRTTFNAMEEYAAIVLADNINKHVETYEAQIKRLQENILEYIKDRDCAVQAYNDTKVYAEKMDLVKEEMLDEIDKLRLGVCQIKDMMVPGKFDIMECNKILERVLAPTPKN